MNIVVIGAGRIGQALASRLSQEGNSITVIDNDDEQLAFTGNNLDVMPVLGNGADYDVQTRAEVGSADLLIAVTNDDAVNMLCCLTAKKLGVKNTVARVSTMEYYRQMVFLKDELGLSLVFNPERATADEVSRILRFPSAEKVNSFAKGRAEMVEYTICAESCLVGLALNKFRHKYGTGILICAVVHGGAVTIPKGDYVLSAGDTIYVVGASTEVTAFFKAAGIYKRGVRAVMIVGGSRIALYLGWQLLEMGIRVKIIERKQENCTELKKLLRKADIICGDGTNPKLLEEEGLRDTDAFVALTGSDQNNIITSMFASKSTPAKVITKVNDDYFLNMIDSHAIESCVTPKSIAADFIVQYVRAMRNSLGVSGIESLHEIADGKAEALEFYVTDSDENIGKPLKSLGIRQDTLLAAIIRDSRCIIPTGDDCVKAGDSVIAVTSRFGMQRFDDVFEDLPL
ncbi:MAG: Trk system potassium transporter TrkA [Oscillospiraceae bacterium]